MMMGWARPACSCLQMPGARCSAAIRWVTMMPDDAVPCAGRGGAAAVPMRLLVPACSCLTAVHAACIIHHAQGSWPSPAGQCLLSQPSHPCARSSAVWRRACLGGVLQLMEAEPLRHLKVSSWLQQQLQAASSCQQGAELRAGMAAMDPAVQQQLQEVLAAAAAVRPTGR
jgi:hypothetical protein